jgi:hypothetical protein
MQRNLAGGAFGKFATSAPNHLGNRANASRYGQGSPSGRPSFASALTRSISKSRQLGRTVQIEGCGMAYIM